MAVKKTRNWDFLIWPDDPRCSPDWFKILEDMKATIGISPLHDKDKLPSGEFKNPHYHCIICWDGPRTYELTKDILSPLNTTIPIPCLSLRGSARYFWHLDNPEKYQYRDNPTCLGGFDFQGLINLPSDNALTLNDIRLFCSKYEVYSLNALLDISHKLHPDWEIFILGHYNLVVKVLKSIKYDKFLETDLNLIYERILKDEN